MTAVTNKRVLVIGPHYGLTAAVAQELDAGNMPVTFVADHTIDWKNEAAVQKLFSQQKPHMLLHEIDLHHPSLRKRRIGELRTALLQRNQSLAAACAKRECIAMNVSDYHVFGGDTKNSYDEADATAPLDGYGALIAGLEQQFVSTVDRHLILRFSWLIDAEGDNLFTRVLAALMRGDELMLSRYRRGAPTWRVDARRVICGMLRQVMSGAENWGYFHYCSADNCNEWEFGREVEATLAELHAPQGKILADDAKEISVHPLEPASATLNSRRIRNNFGVHGRSWRQGLKAQISHWLDRQAEIQPAQSSGKDAVSG
jgi:dTDP-4-dehydrorhamnose reductase